MVLKPDQQRIKDLLSETITLLCRSGLHFKSEFSIEALIGITLDQEDVFLVSIKETVHTDETRKQSDLWVDHTSLDSHRTQSTSVRYHGANEHGSGVTSLRTRRQSDVGLEERPILSPDCNKNLSSFVNSSCQKLMPEPMRFVNHKRLRKDPAPKSYAQGEALSLDVDGDELFVLELKNKRQRLGGTLESAAVPNSSGKVSATKESSGHSGGDADRFNKLCSSGKSFGETNSGVDDITSAIVQESAGNSLQNTEGHSSAAECNGANIHSESDAEKFCDVTHTGSDNDECFKNELIKIKDEPNDESCGFSRRHMKHLFGQLTSSRSHSSRKYGSRGATVGIMHPLVIQQAEPGACSLWQASATQETATGAGSSLSQWMSTGLVDPSNSQTENSVLMDAPPDMTSEQALMAVEVLSISGSFINIGSAKAFQHNLRKLTKGELSEVLEKMTVPASSKYCVGLLCTEGASRVFYKIPPPLIKEEALNFYNMDLSVYSNLYYGPVRVPHNVKEPYEWKCMLEMKSPFNLMTIDSSTF